MTSRKQYNHDWYLKNKDLGKQKEYYQNNRKVILERAKLHRESKRRKIDAIALGYGCQNPGCKWVGPFHPAQLEFHHFDPKLKKFQIGKAADYSYRAIAAEINKCVVLCACCHALFHVGLVEADLGSKLCSVTDKLLIERTEH
jgi:hypothetical protein